MTLKIQLRFDQHTRADEVLDQIVRVRLMQIQAGLADWDSEPDIQAACQSLIDWMWNQHAQETSD